MLSAVTKFICCSNTNQKANEIIESCFRTWICLHKPMYPDINSIFLTSIFFISRLDNLSALAKIKIWPLFVDMIEKREGVHNINTKLFSISFPQLRFLQELALESTNLTTPLLSTE